MSDCSNSEREPRALCVYLARLPAEGPLLRVPAPSSREPRAPRVRLPARGRENLRPLLRAVQGASALALQSPHFFAAKSRSRISRGGSEPQPRIASCISRRPLFGCALLYSSTIERISIFPMR